VPWVITTAGWPALAAHATGATARLAVDPAIAGGAMAGALVCAAALLWRGRTRTLAEAQAPVAVPSDPSPRPPGS
jgi:hypothetical protein